MNNDGHGALAPNQASTAAEEKDPVCGMMVNPATAKHRAEHQGKPYFFCSAKCHDRFVAEPLKYTSPQSQSPDAGPPQARAATVDLFRRFLSDQDLPPMLGEE